MKFRNKTIVIVSQQDWGKMFISKHHYALALAALGNRVYFMNSPDKSGRLSAGGVSIEQVGENLRVINHRFFYPYFLKYKAPGLHRLLLKYHIKKIFSQIEEKVDIVWSFDVSDTIHLAAFPGSCFKIFMPVDNPVNPTHEKRGDVMFSVTTEILDMYHCNTPKMFVNHGVAEYFINDEISAVAGEPIQVGISGNFLRPDIDWPCLMDIVRNNPGIRFNFWGAFNLQDGNLSSNNTPVAEQVRMELSQLNNVVIHGAVDAKTLAVNLRKMDCLLICYDIARDQSGGTNYHKVMEYLASGKVIVSNNITTYQGTGLLEMPEERNNKKLPALFSHVISKLGEYNAVDRRKRRVDYARAHTYRSNITAIEEFITRSLPAHH